jgi:K+-sensing histidine kinase KdpD
MSIGSEMVENTNKLRASMSISTLNLEETGLEVVSLDRDEEFAARRLHRHDITVQMAGLKSLTKAFVENPETILQELVNAAVELCGADSAVISIEKQEKTEEAYYHWIATAGRYSGFLDAVLPQHPSACGVCLAENQPQHFRVTKRFFEILSVEAPIVTDGILLPWETDTVRGTIFVMAHGRTEAFDNDDVALMRILADFAAMAVRHQTQQRALLEQASATAAAAMANDLAHQINNPLQSVTNLLYMAQVGAMEADTRSLAQELEEPVQRLAVLVKRLLTLPGMPSRTEP